MTAEYATLSTCVIASKAKQSTAKRKCLVNPKQRTINCVIASECNERGNQQLKAEMRVFASKLN